MLNAVGIDVSKGKSTVAVLRPAGEIVRKPFNVSHSVKELSELVSYVGSLDGETRVVMDITMNLCLRLFWMQVSLFLL